MVGESFLSDLQESGLGTALSESIYMYPLIEGTHLLSLVFSFGLIFLMDLRLIGLFLPNVTIREFFGSIRIIMITGFIVTFVTGLLLVFVNGPALVKNFVFPLKIFFIVAAVVNAIWFEFKFGRKINSWGNISVAPGGAVLAGWISLICWSLVVALGRLIPYMATH